MKRAREEIREEETGAEQKAVSGEGGKGESHKEEAQESGGKKRRPKKTDKTKSDHQRISSRALIGKDLQRSGGSQGSQETIGFKNPVITRKNKARSGFIDGGEPTKGEERLRSKEKRKMLEKKKP